MNRRYTRRTFLKGLGVGTAAALSPLTFDLPDLAPTEAAESLPLPDLVPDDAVQVAFSADTMQTEAALVAVEEAIQKPDTLFLVNSTGQVVFSSSHWTLCVQCDLSEYLDHASPFRQYRPGLCYTTLSLYHIGEPRQNYDYCEPLTMLAINDDDSPYTGWFYYSSHHVESTPEAVVMNVTGHMLDLRYHA